MCSHVMKLVALISILFLVVPSYSATKMTMAVGEQRIIKNKSGSSVIVSNPKVVKVLATQDKLNIIAKLPGKAQVQAGKLEIKLVIYALAVEEVIKAASKLVGGGYGLAIEIEPDRVLITGTANRLKDWTAIQRLKTLYGKRFTSHVELSQRLLPQLEEEVTMALKNRSLLSAHTKIHQNHIELLSFTKDKSQIAAINEIAEEWGLNTIAGSQTVELKPMIEVEVIIAEVKKNAVQNLGVQWPGNYSATIIPAGDLSSATTTFNGITPQLNALFSDEENKVLANPRLLCRSGETAHFVAGGEIPIKIFNWKSSDVIWKRYGVILDITPLADLSQGISTKLVTEISLIDEAHTVEHIPGFLTNRIETHFDIRGSKTIALSGLIKSEVGRGTTGTPLLGQIPILGELFKSHNYRDNRTELVVFVTPRVISPENPPNVKAPTFEPGFWKDSDQ
jgi:pilus assembly protein CpaC